MGSSGPERPGSGKIVPISWDAGFFFERAVTSLDRYHYDKALKYFRKALEYEPNNPVNHCNLAGILSEMGDFKASNDILLIVLQEIDPDMTECYFYMANNYANMDLFEAAEEALVTYLEKDTSGQFLTEAEEMLELLQYELKRPAKLKSIKAREGAYEHDLARDLLEEGKFTQAVKVLEGIVEQYPDFHSARNNLALGYYYLGLFRKAMDTIQEVLHHDPGNLHGLCNLAVFYQHEGKQAELKELADTLRRIVPFHLEHVFKLATTMGILGEHEAAYQHFKRLLHGEEMNGEPSIYHYTAVAAYNTKRYEEAEKLWTQLSKIAPETGISVFYLNLLEHYGIGARPLTVSYHYHLPFEEQFKKWETAEGMVPDDLKNNPLIRSSFFWALRHGDAKTKLQVIQALGVIADTEVEEALKAFILDPEEDPALKKIAHLVLRQMEVSAATAVSTPGGSLPVWRAEWQSVLDLARSRVEREWSEEAKLDMERLWIDFLTRLYPDTPPITHIEGWAAALEYLTAKMYRQPITYNALAECYGISASTVRRYVRRVEEVCAVMEKAETIAPSV